MDVRTKVILLLVGIVVIITSLPGCKTENHPPYISAVAVTPDIIEVGETASVTLVVVDEENDPLTITYTVDGGYISGKGISVGWTAPSVPGAYGLTVTVTDPYGGSAVGNGSLTVVFPPTQIIGTVLFSEGFTGDLSNSVVRLYSSWENWRDIKPVMKTGVIGGGESVSFTFNDIDPGTYLLDVWSDNDRDSIWSGGDFIGWHGTGGFEDIELTEIEIEEGMRVTVQIEMLVI